jgi:hypothetical protein
VGVGVGVGEPPQGFVTGSEMNVGLPFVVTVRLCDSVAGDVDVLRNILRLLESTSVGQVEKSERLAICVPVKTEFQYAAHMTVIGAWPKPKLE